MRPLPRSLALVLLSLPVVAGVACGSSSSDDLPSTNLYDGGGVNDGSASVYDGGGGADTGGGPADAGSDAARATCNGLTAGAPVASPNLVNEPAGVGGTIVDGTYVLIASQAIDTADGGPGMSRSAAIKFQGNQVAMVTDLDSNGQPMSECCTGTYSIVNTTEISLGVTCGADGGPILFQFGYDAFPTDAGKNVVRLHFHRTFADYLETYAKQ